MEYISLLGIFVGVIVFIICVSRGINLVISAIAAALIMIVSSGQPIIPMFTDQWAVGFAGYLQRFFLIFILGAIFGKLLNDGGGSKSIALGLYRIISKSKKQQKFWAVAFVPMSYGVLTYVGVSGLVIVYTVIDISAELFKRFDCPWRLYTNGGTASIGTFFLGGSLQLINIAPMQFTNTPLTAGMMMSVVCSTIFYLTMAFFIKYDLKKAEKRGEGFLETGKTFYQSTNTSDALSDENLPPVWLSVIPMITMIVLAGIVKINVIAAIAVGCALCIIVFFKRYKSIVESITNGLLSAYNPIIGVAATSAIGLIIKSVPGFTLITSGLSNLEPLYEGIALISIVTFITSAAPGAINSFGEEVNRIFTEQVGLSPAISHRLMTVAAFTGVPPHSPGVNNAIAIAKLEYKKGVVVYLRTGMIGGFLALLAAILMIKLNIFV